MMHSLRYEDFSHLRTDDLERLKNHDSTLTEIKGKYFTKKELKQLADALAGNYKLKKIILTQPDDFNAIDANFKILANALPKAPALSEICFPYIYIKNKGAKALAAVLPQMQSLTSLDLSGNQIGDSGIQAILTALTKIPTFASLNLMVTRFSLKNIHALADTLPKISNLTSLNLQGSNVWKFKNFFGNEEFNNKGIIALANALPYISNLRSLNLAGTDIQDPIVEIIASVLPRVLNLTSLNLGSNIFVTGNSLIHIAAVLHRIPGLISLNFNDNFFGKAYESYTVHRHCDDALIALATALPRATALTSLDIGSAIYIGNEGATALFTAISNTPTLASLSLEPPRENYNMGDRVKQILDDIQQLLKKRKSAANVTESSVLKEEEAKTIVMVTPTQPFTSSFNLGATPTVRTSLESASIFREHKRTRLSAAQSLSRASDVHRTASSSTLNDVLQEFKTTGMTDFNRVEVEQIIAWQTNCQTQLQLVEERLSVISDLTQQAAEAKQEQAIINSHRHIALQEYQHRLQQELAKFMTVYWLSTTKFFKISENKKEMILESAGSLVPGAGVLYKILTFGLRKGNEKYRYYQINRLADIFTHTDLAGTNGINEVCERFARQITIAKAAEIKAHRVEERLTFFDKAIGFCGDIRDLIKEQLFQEWSTSADMTGVKLKPSEALAILDSGFLLDQILLGKVKIDNNQDLVKQFLRIFNISSIVSASSRASTVPNSIVRPVSVPAMPTVYSQESVAAYSRHNMYAEQQSHDAGDQKQQIAGLEREAKDAKAHASRAEQMARDAITRADESNQRTKKLEEQIGSSASGSSQVLASLFPPASTSHAAFADNQLLLTRVNQLGNAVDITNEDIQNLRNENELLKERLVRQEDKSSECLDRCLVM